MPVTPFPGIQVEHKGADYAVLDEGAQVLAWTPPGQNRVLWVSPLMSFEPGVPVRGGVPVVFPWFGKGPGGDRTPAHGFARTTLWRRTSVQNDPAAGTLTVRHALDETDVSSAPFTAELTSSFNHQRLEVSLTVRNTGTDLFAYEEALHTYLRVADVRAIEVGGLDGCGYLDRADGAGEDELTQAGPVRFDAEVDRVYRHAGEVVVSDPEWSREIRVAKSGSANTVIWNPGPTKGSALADVGRGWPKFVCVEAGNVRDAAIRLAPGEEHTLTQSVHLA
jgi:glucose-6-phosphate 1-epimerase